MGGSSSNVGSVRLERRGQATRITLRGEIDLQAKPLLDEAVIQLASAEPTDVHVDLRGVTFLGSTGLGFLVQLGRQAAATWHGLNLINPSPVALRALKISRLYDVFAVRYYGAEPS